MWYRYKEKVVLETWTRPTPYISGPRTSADIFSVRVSTNETFLRQKVLLRGVDYMCDRKTYGRSVYPVVGTSLGGFEVSPGIIPIPV